MKRIAYLLLVSLVSLLCSCSVNVPESVQTGTGEFSLPKTLNICIQDPQTKMTIGELDPDANNYPLMLTPYDFDGGKGDYFYLYGAKGDISDFDFYDVTLVGSYCVVSVDRNISTLVLDGFPEAFGKQFENSDYFVMVNNYFEYMYQFENGEIGSGVKLAGWFTKAEVLSMMEEISNGTAGQDSVLPIYPLTSLLKIHVTFPQLDNELSLDCVTARTPGTCPRKSLDFSKLPQMIEGKTVYGSSISDYTCTYLDETISSGDAVDVFVPIDPGHYDSLILQFDMADDVFTYDVPIESRRGFDIASGNVYTSSLTISKEQMEANRGLIPVLAVGSKSFWISDPDEENARPLKEKLATCPVVFAGYGRSSDFSNDTCGKVVVVSRGEITFSDKIYNAQNAGAEGIIIYNNQPGQFYMDLTALFGRKKIPAIATTQEFGQYLSSHPDEKVSIWTDISDIENATGK